MHTETPFAEVLEAVDQLSLDDQQSVVEILRSRIIEQRRNDLVADVEEAEAEFRAGKAVPRSARQLIDEILG
ncbi:MAG TPA: hypothetical protein VN851_11310 [Thermoanaerobaculia bacterium]|nr:hypothetical protein [Thermoanaerobaculia bacterium]